VWLAACAGVVLSAGLPAGRAAAHHIRAATGTVVGAVTTAEGLAPLQGVEVYIEGTSRGAITDESGTYRITGVPAGIVVVITRYIGRRVGRQETTVTAGATVRLDFRLDVEAVPVTGVVVSASREAQRRAETPATIGVIASQSLRDARPTHPSEIMNRVAGVWVNVTGGEGHMTAIRQPKTTNPVYLYAEDGVPTRSTGFFNHNALYEVNVPAAERIEVVKGPASALYGSDAIGGVVNVVTRSPSEDAGVSATVEGGAWGFGRLLAAGSWLRGANGVRAELNVTRTDGWRDGTAYDRQTGSIRWDRTFDNGATLRTLATFSRIDQGTAGSSAISRDDYLSAPESNYTPISFRRIKAFRMHAAYEKIAGDALISVTPFVRWNRMEILPNWTLTFDPGVWDTGHGSVGALLKYRRDFEPLRARVIAGADIDFSPGWHREETITAVRQDKVFASYTPGATVYDYDVNFFAVSPYLQAEATAAKRLHLVGGLRFDHIGYDYDNALGELTTGRHRRPTSTTVTYDHVSPKLGATLDVARWLNVFGAYSHGFRAPSEGQLFRQGQALNTLGLEPVRARNLEVGARGQVAGRVDYELAAYHMTKYDDILSFTNVDGSTETVNAGETLHRGVEAGVGVGLGRGLRIDASYSVARHTYEEWRPRPTVDLSGNQMEDAPREIGNVVASWMPSQLRGGGVSLEWQRIGKYWMDADNTHRYPGHDLLNLRASYRVMSRALVFGRLMNVLDQRYAEGAAYTVARGEEFAPGLPRGFYLGVEVR
jgi:outer membrane receptor protein involved in Fe transport